MYAVNTKACECQILYHTYMSECSETDTFATVNTHQGVVGRALAHLQGRGVAVLVSGPPRPASGNVVSIVLLIGRPPVALQSLW